jgi:hypothetical protein
MDEEFFGQGEGVHGDGSLDLPQSTELINAICFGLHCFVVSYRRRNDCSVVFKGALAEVDAEAIRSLCDEMVTAILSWQLKGRSHWISPYRCPEYNCVQFSQSLSYTINILCMRYSSVEYLSKIIPPSPQRAYAVSPASLVREGAHSQSCMR